jgi:hypothetical protein
VNDYSHCPICAQIHDEREGTVCTTCKATSDVQAIHDFNRAAGESYHEGMKRLHALLEPEDTSMTYEEMERINEMEMWGPAGRPRMPAGGW